MEGREGGGGSWETTPSRPLQPLVGTKGETTEPALGGTAASNRAELGRGKGYPTASPLGARHARPPFPARSLTKPTFFRAAQNTRSRRTTDDPVRSPRSPAQKLRGCWRRGSRRGPPAPSPRARSPTHPVRPLRADSRSSERAAGGDGARGGGPRSAGRSVAEPAHLGRQLLAPVDSRAREGFDPRHNPA